MPITDWSLDLLDGDHISPTFDATYLVSMTLASTLLGTRVDESNIQSTSPTITPSKEQFLRHIAWEVQDVHAKHSWHTWYGDYGPLY